MATLTSAVAIGDTQLLLNASLAGDFPAYVKVDDEVLPVGGVGATGTVLALSEPAQATHNQGATVTYAGRPYDEDFLAATAGEGGGGGAAVDVTFTPNGSIAATDVQAAIQEVRDEAGGGLSVLEDPGNVWEAETVVPAGHRIIGGADEEKIFEVSGVGGETGTVEPDFDAVDPQEFSASDGAIDGWVFIGFLDNLPFTAIHAAEFVANGSTTDELRDSLIAAGFMRAS